MNTSKITYEYIRGSANISSTAEECDIPRPEVVKAILSFLKGHPESSWYNKILRKLQIELTKLFLAAPGNAKEFAEEYGMSESKFIGFMSTTIDDTELIVSDSLANKLYHKLLVDKYGLGAQTPKRIIRIIGKAYVSNNWITQDSIANTYGISRSTVSYLLTKGINDEIFDDEIANMVANKVQNKRRRYVAR